MQPDYPTVSCCGDADAYWADSYEVKGDQYIAIIADTRDEIHLAGYSILRLVRGSQCDSKIKWGSGNPTGHGNYSSLALPVTSFVTYRLGEDSPLVRR